MRFQIPVLVLGLLLVLFPSPIQSQDREYKIKAEFLERFTRFIEWPAGSTVSDLSSPFTLCVIGKSRYGSYLQSLAATVKIHNKDTALRELSSVEQVKNCDLLFISDSEKDTLPSILAYTADKPILTVGDTRGFAERGVLINFYEDAEFIRFEINVAAVHQSGLRFSSRLLKLARLIDSQKTFPGGRNAIP